MNEIFLDSSAIYSYVDRNDQEGSSIASLIQQKTYSIVTTNFIFAESMSLITKRLGKHVGLKTGELLQQSDFVRLVCIEEKMQKAAWQLYKQFKDKDFDLIDAISFVYCRKHKIKEVITLDAHFSQMGFTVIP